MYIHLFPSCNFDPMEQGLVYFSSQVWQNIKISECLDDMASTVQYQ